MRQGRVLAAQFARRACLRVERQQRAAAKAVVRLMAERPQPIARPWGLRFYRAGVLLALVWLVHAQSRWLEAQRGAGISLRQAQRFFPKADRVQLRDPDRGLHVVLDARGNSIGALLKTSPFTDQ